MCQVVGPRLQFGLHVICCQDDNDRPTPVPHVYYGDIDSQMAAYWSRAASADKSTTTSDSPGHAGAETVLLETRSGEEVPGATAQSPLQHTSGGMSASPRPRVSVKSLTSSSNISGSVSNGMNTGRKDAALRRWLSVGCLLLGCCCLVLFAVVCCCLLLSVVARRCLLLAVRWLIDVDRLLVA